jgi:C1A family cysteine protease
LRAALVKGPVVLAMDTLSYPIRYYQGGIINNTKMKACTTQVNHFVLAVGYGHDAQKNMDFVLVKNSYGEGWGEKGYARVSLNDPDPQGTCGILTELVQA